MKPEKAVLVDTGVWYAVADRSDRHHREAIDHYRQIFKDFYQVIVTNLIIAESYNIIRRTLGYRAGSNFLNNLTASPRVKMVFSNRETEERAGEILRRYQDQDFSYTDAVSFAIMEKMDIRHACTFDRHFIVAGFEAIPSLK